MESQATLVNRLPAVSLTLSPDSVKNASLITSHSTAVYSITSSPANDYLTEITEAATQRVVAVIKRRDVIPDVVTFPGRNGGLSMRVGKWLKNITLPDGYPAKMVETEHGRCIWKSYGLHRLALFTENDLETPIAYFQSATQATPSTLVLESGTERIQDDIVVGLVYLEQKQRMNEKIIKVADSKAQVLRANAMGNNIRP